MSTKQTAAPLNDHQSAHTAALAAPPSALTGGPVPTPQGALATLQNRAGNQAVTRLLQTKPLAVGQPGDQYEREADQVADAVVTAAAGAPFFAVTGRTSTALQREEKPATPPKTESEQYKEAAKKVGEAFLKTPLGKQLTDKAKEAGEAFLATLPGKIIAGTAATGAVTALIATNTALPVQLPEIPLDILHPGLKMKITYEGPVQQPTNVLITFGLQVGGSTKPEPSKAGMSETEKTRAETARLAAEQAKFRESLKPPAERATEDQAFWDTFWRLRAADPLNPLRSPGVKPKPRALPLLPKREAQPVQRNATAAPTTPTVAPPIVDQVLRSTGQALDRTTQTQMEAALGYDFSQVRIHTDPQAAQSAQAVNARAYTVAQNVVFGSGQYAPNTLNGQHLLAHELAHVVQQHHNRVQPTTLAYSTATTRLGNHASRPVQPLFIPAMMSPPQVARSGSEGASKTPAPTPAPAPAPAPAPVVDPVVVKAQADAQLVLVYIKTEAQTRAKKARSVSTSSKFYKRLQNFYLKDYLKKPSAAAGKKAATDKIGKSFAGPATAGDQWEQGALGFWNKQKIPEFARRLRPALPAELAAATDILSRPNRKHLPLIDTPHLVGGSNTGTAFDADVAGGGANISQLMHWGTGVKYSDIDKRTMRELFLAYEMWHLEAWEIFGEDPINDLIAEEAGRILGTQLRAGSITDKNLQSQLNTGFDEARAWVGSLLRVRQAEFDKWILAEKQEKANMWWGAQAPLDVWGSETIFTKLKAGESVEAVKKSGLVERIINIYTLIFEVDAWEAKNGKIDNGDFIQMMQSGQLNTVFKKMAKGDPVTTIDVMNPGAAP